MSASMIHNDAIWSSDKLQIAMYAQDRYQLDIREPSLHNAAWELRCGYASAEQPGGRRCS